MSIAIMLAMGTAVHSQSITKDAKGNYVTTANLWKAKDSIKGKPSGKTFTDAKGVIYDVFIGPKGGVYYINSNGKKMYLPK